MRRKTTFVGLLAVAAMVALAAGNSRYQAAEACFMRAPQPVQVVLDRIDVEINENVAVKHYDCHFANPNGNAIVGGVCYMELDPEAQIDNLSMSIAGEKVEAEILEVAKANEVFQDIVRNGGNPALLEYYGNRLVRTQVPNVPAGGEAVVQLQYTQVLKPQSGVYRLSMLNTNPKMKMEVLKKAEVSIKIKSEHGVTNLYSPTHPIQIDEAVEDGIQVRWSQENYLPKNPFVIYWSLDDSKIGASVLAHREAGDEDGHFMIMVSPTMMKGDAAGAVTDADVMAKDIVFVTDTSGSMVENNKIEQAKDALRYCVENLRDGDRFNIVDFSTTTRTFRDGGLVPVDADSRAAALKYIDGMKARGGTAISEALTTAINQFAADDRLKMVFFTTDGMPTIGERDADKLLANVKEANGKNIRLFTFGEGVNVNSRFLDMLAYENRGESDYILPEENIKTKIATYFDKVGSPMLADLSVKVKGDGVQVRDVYPRTLPDLFRGDRVVIFGEYTGAGPVTVTVTGLMNGVERKYDFQVELPEESTKSPFVPRLWAGRKVNYLLSEVRKDGKDQELIDEIVKVALRYGIVTPYTAFLAMTDGVNSMEEQAKSATNGFRQLRNREQGLGAPGGAPASPADMDAMTRAAGRLAEARDDRAGADMYNSAEMERKALGGEGSVLNSMRYIGSRTFYNFNGVWTDSQYTEANKDSLVEIKVNSEEYFKLLGDNPGLAKYFAMNSAIVKWKTSWFKLVPDGEPGH